MSEGHATPDDLERYVTGALDPARAAWVEDHVPSCAPCARALEREARIEVALRDVARAERPALASPTRPARRPRAVRWALGAVAAALAIAASALLFRGQPPRAGAFHVLCGAAGDAELRGCRAAARCAGLLAEDAPRAADVPVYEALDPGCAATPALSFAGGRGDAQ